MADALARRAPARTGPCHRGGAAIGGRLGCVLPAASMSPWPRSISPWPAGASRARRPRARPRAAGSRSASSAVAVATSTKVGVVLAELDRDARGPARRCPCLQVRRVGALTKRDAVAHLADPPGALGHLVEVVRARAARRRRRPRRGRTLRATRSATTASRALSSPRDDARSSRQLWHATAGLALTRSDVRMERGPRDAGSRDIGHPNALPSSWPSTTIRTRSSSSASELEDRYGRATRSVTARAATTALDQLTATAGIGRPGGAGPLRPVAARRHGVRAARPGRASSSRTPGGCCSSPGASGRWMPPPSRCAAASASDRSTTTRSSRGGPPTSSSIGP